MKNLLFQTIGSNWHCIIFNKWTASSEFGTYRLCEQRRFRRACASAQSRQNLRCSLIEAVSQEEPSDRKSDPWPLWMAGHAQLKFVMTECSKTQIRLTGLKYVMVSVAKGMQTRQQRYRSYCHNTVKQALGPLARSDARPPDIQTIAGSILQNSFSSPEPKTHWWVYSIGRHPSSVVCQHFQTTSPLKPWSRHLPNFTYSIYRPGEQIIVFCSNRIRTLVAMATYSCHWLIMGKSGN